MPAQWRAEAARERNKLRADLCARAERAEREADGYRAALAQLRAETEAHDDNQRRAQVTAAPRGHRHPVGMS